MAETQKNTPNQNPSGIWQGLWAELFRLIFDQMTQKNYIEAWNSSQILLKQIPPECETEVQPQIEKIVKITKKTVFAYTVNDAQKMKNRLVANELPSALLELIGAIRTSLYKDGWINKDFSISPINRKVPHIQSDS